jgi:cytochrome c
MRSMLVYFSLEMSKMNFFYACSVVALFGAMAIATPARAATTPQDLLKSSGCLGCHAIGKKGALGPDYKEVAKKYRDDKNAEAKLIAKVKKGGGGVWGAMPMPPQNQVKDEDIKTLVHYILSLK